MILEPTLRRYEFFRFVLTTDQLNLFIGASKQTVIFELEVLPVLVARHLWSDYLANRSFFCFVDNESAKAALTASYSSNAAVVQLLTSVSSLDVADGALAWYERVPTLSNPADAPSRGEIPPALSQWPAPREINTNQVLKDIILVFSAGLAVGSEVRSEFGPV